MWFILGGGAIFAAFPLIYAAAFSGFFVALILVLFALILRPVGFDYRSKLADPRWRSLWDVCLFIGGFVPALVFGVAFGNLLLGVPFRYDEALRVYYDGNFFGLLNPFALLVGVVSLSLLVMHARYSCSSRPSANCAPARGAGIASPRWLLSRVSPARACGSHSASTAIVSPRSPARRRARIHWPRPSSSRPARGLRISVRCRCCG